MLPVLEVLSRQVSAVADKGNSSTDELSRSFVDMASNANELVTQVAGESGDESGIASVRQVLSSLLEKFQETNQAAATTGETLAQIESELVRVEECASQVRSIALQARLVSFNGRIEAERAGKHGEGFAVVADETGKLALAISSSNQEIGEAISGLTTKLRTTLESMETLVKSGESTAHECEKDVDDTLNQLMVYQHHLETNLQRARTTGDSLSRAISESIIGLQFQDALSQRMRQVSNSLDSVRSHLSELVPSNDQTEQRSKYWLDKMSEDYVMLEQRDIHQGESDAGAASDMSNVELF